VDGVATELGHPGLEADAGPERRLLEDHRQRLAEQSVAVGGGILLDARREIEDRGGLLGPEVVDRDQVDALHGLPAPALTPGARAPRPARRRARRRCGSRPGRAPPRRTAPPR